MSKRKKYSITTKDFIEFVISDDDSIYDYGLKLFKELKDTGRSSFSGRGLFKEIESLPGYLFANQMNESDRFLGTEFEEISTEDIKLIPSGSLS
jgi:hypothetical protein